MGGKTPPLKGEAKKPRVEEIEVLTPSGVRCNHRFSPKPGKMKLGGRIHPSEG